MSAKWRRRKKRSKWFDIFGTANDVKGNNTPRTFRIKNSSIKKQTYPYRYMVPKIHRERKWRGPKPLIDVLEDKDEIIVVAQFAGFRRDNLRVHVKNQRLILSAEALDCKYYKSLNLPKRVLPNTLRITYKNGVLEIRLKKAVEEKTIKKMAG